jgi:Na+:H+ antiporter, NhaA family
MVLVVAVVVALAWSNSPFDGGYRELVDGHGWADLHVWVDEGLMTIFFLVVGLEIKRELVLGELRDRASAVLPVVAAVGGMVVPAALYFAVAAGTAGSHGWGIPMATDIAMAVGVMALLGSRVPSPLKLFLLALAIVDDLGAIIVIAVFYSDAVAIGSLAVALALVGLLVALRLAKVQPVWPYVLVSVGIWWALHDAGVHPTLAGVCLAFALPAARLEHVEHVLHPLSSFVIVPVFALVNAGVSVGAGLSRTSVAVIVGLVVGKPLGIVGASALAVRTRVANLPAGTTWRDLIGVASLAGIGFTVSIFVSRLAFSGGQAAASADGGVDAALLGVLVASVVAAVAGALLIVTAPRAATGADDDQVV